MSKNNIIQLIAWSIYDWASAAFPIIITTFVFATYFTTSVAANKIIGTYQWANAAAFAGFIIAIFSPIFGAIADHAGHHKIWLILFTLLSVLFTALLWFVYPNVSSVPFALFCVILGTIFLELATVFYNSFLPHIAPPNYIGRISGWAWGAGYVGGIVLLSIVLFVFIKNPPSWLNVQQAENIRFSAILVAVWYAVFSLPIFIFIPDTPSTGLSLYRAIQKGLLELGHTLKSLPKMQNLVLFLFARMIYIDGLNTLFAFGGIYAAGTFKMDLSLVIIFGITINISAGIGAILLGWVDDWLGSKPTILISLVCMTLLGIPVILVENMMSFWILSLILCLFVGPVQAASRSFMARVTPLNKSTELFGLYAFSGRITAFIGPWLLGWATYYFNSQRAGVATILLFFIVGTALMWKVKEKA